MFVKAQQPRKKRKTLKDENKALEDKLEEVDNEQTEKEEEYKQLLGQERARLTDLYARKLAEVKKQNEEKVAGLEEWYQQKLATAKAELEEVHQQTVVHITQRLQHRNRCSLPSNCLRRFFLVAGLRCQLLELSRAKPPWRSSIRGLPARTDPLERSQKLVRHALYKAV